MRVKTATMEGAQLDWAVAKAQGADFHHVGGELCILWTEKFDVPLEDYTPSTDWVMGGPIIEWGGIDVRRYEWEGPSMKVLSWSAQFYGTEAPCFQTGPTPLIAAMRCYVASKFGETLDIPEELT